jgi:HEAT repeat protein
MMNPNPQTRQSGADGVAKAGGTAEKAEAVFNCLSKLVLGKKIYAKNNPALLRFSSEFAASLHDFFEDEDVLVVSIDKHQILWNEQVVYENDRRDESIAFILYKDGVGELTIHKTVTPQETEQFVDLIKEAVKAVWQDEDIVTQLWKADFEHISYRVLDNYLLGQFGEGRRGEAEARLASLETEDHPDAPGLEEKGRVIVGVGEEVEPIDRYLRKLVGHGSAGMSDENKEEHFQNMMASFFTVSSDELRTFKEKLFETKKKDGIVGFISELLDFVSMKDNPRAVRDVMDTIERLVDYLISELHGPILAALFENTRQFGAKHTSSDEVREFVAGLERKLTDPAILLSLGETVGSSDEIGEDAFAYFECVGEKAIPAICKVIEEHTDPRLHKKARESLVRVAGGKLPEVIGQLDIDKPQIARDVIALANAARFREIPQIVKELVYYPDDHVRHEAIQFLAGFGSAEALALLTKLLDDADKAVRLKTLAVVSDVDAAVVREKLVEIAFGKEFAEREFDEQTEIFKALGKVVGEAALPKLRNNVGKRGFLGLAKRHTKMNKLLAIEALEQIDRPGAKKLLDDLANDSDDAVRSRAAEALGTKEEPGSSAGRDDDLQVD